MYSAFHLLALPFSYWPQISIFGKDDWMASELWIVGRDGAASSFAQYPWNLLSSPLEFCIQSPTFQLLWVLIHKALDEEEWLLLGRQKFPWEKTIFIPLIPSFRIYSMKRIGYEVYSSVKITSQKCPKETQCSRESPASMKWRILPKRNSCAFT